MVTVPSLHIMEGQFPSTHHISWLQAHFLTFWHHISGRVWRGRGWGGREREIDRDMLLVKIQSKMLGGNPIETWELVSCSWNVSLHLINMDFLSVIYAGSLSHSECSSPSLVTPPQSPLNLETSSFASSQSQNSLSTLPRISVSPVSMGQRRKDK